MRRVMFAIACVCWLGCGSELATVSGTVTLDGGPLSGSEALRGTVQFFPRSGRGAAAVGYVDEHGRYSLVTGSQRGTKPGSYLVAVAATEIIPPQVAGEAPGGRPATPRRYANPKESGFSAQVKPGSNTFDFALLSQHSE